MACDDTAWGRQVNRRVEVWLRSEIPVRAKAHLTRRPMTT